MGQTVYGDNEKIHFDLRGNHSHSLRIYDFDDGEFKRFTIQEVREEYSDNMQRKFFTEVLRFSQGSFRRNEDEIVYEVDNMPLGAVFKIADKQKNKNGEIANFQLNTVGSVTFKGRRIMKITHKTNRELYKHFVTAMNNRVKTADLF